MRSPCDCHCRQRHPELGSAALNLLFQEVDLNGDGALQPNELATLLHAPPPPPPGAQPHLVLCFDLNQARNQADN
eukprot:5423946-Prymnesium_polylepis.1